MYKYSETTAGFYIEGMHVNIPSDAVSISSAQYEALIQEHVKGRRIVLGSDGIAVIDETPDVSQSAEEVREKRDALLRDTDWYIVRAYETKLDIPEEMVVYRKDLRDIPEQPDFPGNVIWPEKPDQV